MNAQENILMMEENKQNEVVNMISDLKSLDEALRKCKSEDIFKSIAQTSSNFFYELIQNADDAEATEIEFLISNDKIVVTNNGKKFGLEDITKLCGVSHQKKDKGLIGRFGVGFKIVHTIANRVDLYSNGYYLKIEDFINVNILRKGYTEFCNDNTTFVLHLYKGDEEYKLKTGQNTQDRKELSSIIEEAKEFENTNFVFLNFIEKIKILYNNKVVFKFHKEKEITDLKIEGEVIKFVDKVFFSGNEKYLIFKSQSDKDKTNKEYLKIAYRIDDNNRVLKQYGNDRTSVLYAFFPLESVNTGLNFLVHANFTPELNRTHLKLSGNNIELFNKLLGMIGESIVEIINLGYEINYALYPLTKKSDVNNPTTEYIYNKVIDQIVEVFRTKPVILGEDSKYHFSKEILKVNSNHVSNNSPGEKTRLKENFKSTKQLFKTSLFSREETVWINSELEQLLDNFVENDKDIIDKIEIREIKIADILHVMKDFRIVNNEKDQEWLLDFYRYLFYDKKLIEICKTFNLFKTNTGEFVSIKSNDRDYNLYLDISNSIEESNIDLTDINIFNKELLREGDLHEIIKNSKTLISFDLKDIIENIIDLAENKLFTEKEDGKKYLNEEAYFNTLTKIIDYMLLIKSSNNKDVVNLLLRKLPISGCRELTSYLTEKNKSSYYIYLSEDSCVHWDDRNIFNLFLGKESNKDELKALTINNNSVHTQHYLVDSNKYKEKLSKDNYEFWSNFVYDLGLKKGIFINEKFRFYNGYKFKSEYNINSFKNRIQPNNHYNSVDLYVPSLLYVEQIIHNISYENSKRLWDLICELFKSINFSTEAYILNYYGQQEQRIILENEFIYLLQNSGWLYKQDDNNLYEPLNIKYSDLEKNGYFSEEGNMSNYKKMCNLLNISLDSKRSKRSINIQDEIDKLSNEDELIQLVDFLNEKVKMMKLKQ
ncbi:ATP-binding protein [Paenibacillus sp. MCAF9]|uniref:ATP-binding protein n=1 Tax=Paenibacillus sp. MCAF9 TaxID=3233046 RepID=UPI003F9A378F